MARGPEPACYLFLDDSWAKNGFDLIRWWEKIKIRIIFHVTRITCEDYIHICEWCP